MTPFFSAKKEKLFLKQICSVISLLHKTIGFEFKIFFSVVNGSKFLQEIVLLKIFFK